MEALVPHSHRPSTGRGVCKPCRAIKRKERRYQHPDKVKIFDSLKHTTGMNPAKVARALGISYSHASLSARGRARVSKDIEEKVNQIIRMAENIQHRVPDSLLVKYELEKLTGQPIQEVVCRVLI